MSSRKKLRKSKEQKPRNEFLLYGLLCLLFYPPFVKGLFFVRDILVLNLFLILLFALIIYFDERRRCLEVIAVRTDYGVLAVLLIYIISTFYAVAPDQAITEVFKIINYIIIFYLVCYFAYNKRNIDRIMYAIYFSGLGVAVIGILAGTGCIDAANLVEANRIYSTIGYPNALAAYLISVLVIGLYLSVEQPNIYIKAGLETGNYLLFLTFLGTQSRGGLLLLPVSMALLIFGPLKQKRWPVIKNIAVAVAMGTVIYIKSLSDSAVNTGSLRIVWVFVGILIVAVISYLLEKFNSYESWVRINKRYVAIITVIVVAGGLAIGLIAAKSTVSTAFSRFNTISLKDQNVQERMVFYKDALKVIKDHPVLGIGGGGWGSVYKSYRSYAYASRAVHNHFLQTMVETGAIGLIIYLLLVAGFVVTVIRNMRHTASEDGSLINWIVMTVAITLLLHSIIDFNLMIGAVSIVLWVMFGLARGLEQHMTEERKPLFGYVARLDKRTVRSVLTGVLTVVALFSVLLYTGKVYGGQGVYEFNNTNQKLTAEKDLALGIQFDPLNADYKEALAQIWLAKAGPGGDRKMLLTALDYAQGSIKTDWYDPDKHIVLGKIYLSLEQPEKGISEYEIAVKLDPTNQQRYNDLAGMYYRAGRYYAFIQKKEEARRYFDKVLTVSDMINEETKKIPFSDKMPWVRQQYNLTISKEIKHYQIQARLSEAKLR